jgi:hypothetical protein
MTAAAPIAKPPTAGQVFHHGGGELGAGAGAGGAVGVAAPTQPMVVMGYTARSSYSLRKYQSPPPTTTSAPRPMAMFLGVR